jgi:hypothetical protein
VSEAYGQAMDVAGANFGGRCGSRRRVHLRRRVGQQLRLGELVWAFRVRIQRQHLLG